MGIMLTLLQCIHTLCLPLGPRLHEDGLCPQDARIGTVLQCLCHESQCDTLLASSHLKTDGLQPGEKKEEGGREGRVTGKDGGRKVQVDGGMGWRGNRHSQSMQCITLTIAQESEASSTSPSQEQHELW